MSSNLVGATYDAQAKFRELYADEAAPATELAYTYQGNGPFGFTPEGWGTPIEELSAYIASSPEWGNDPADYAIVTRQHVAPTTGRSF